MTSIFQEKDKIEILVLDSEKNSTNSPKNSNNDTNNEPQECDQESKVESQKLIQKCLKELVDIYRISTLIELCFFLIFLSIFFVYDFHNNNVYDAWAINKAVKTQFYISALNPYKENEHDFTNIIGGFNSIVKSFDSLQDSVKKLYCICLPPFMSKEFHENLIFCRTKKNLKLVKEC